MLAWLRQRKNGISFLKWRSAPESPIDLTINQFLSDISDLAEDAAILIDSDLRHLIQQLVPADAAQYESVVRVPGAFPPYLVWAALAAFDSLPLHGVFEPALAHRVEKRLLDVAAQARGKLNARLLSALLYRLQREAAAGDVPLDALVLRFWDEVQRMGALSEAGRDILANSQLANDTVAKRLLAASRLHDKRYGGNFWISTKASIEQEARDLGWL